MGALADLRAQVADILDVLNEDWPTYPAPVDSIAPPAYMVLWSDPWLVPMTACASSVRLDVLAIAGRIDPEPDLATLESMIEASSSALLTAGFPPSVSAPAPFEIGGLRYLAARVTVSKPLTFGG